MPDLKSNLFKRVLDRAKLHDPNLIVQEMDGIHDYPFTVDNTLPPAAREKEFWKKCKQSILLRDKGIDQKNGGLRFVHVFVAVNATVETHQFVIGGENECPFDCQFCYLQGTFEHSPVPTVFTNLQDDGLLLREIKISLLAMQMYSQVMGPSDNVGRGGQDTIHGIIGALNRSVKAVDKNDTIENIFNANKDSISQSLKRSRIIELKPFYNYLDNFDFKNMKRRFHYNCGELGDGLANDHLTDNSKFLSELFANESIKNDGGYLLIRTKSNNIANLKDAQHNGNTTVSFSMTAKAFVEGKGPATTEERIKAARELQDLGYRIRPTFDPVIMHGDPAKTVKIYSEILDMIRDNLILDHDLLDPFTYGSLRFSVDTIRRVIPKRHPGLVDYYKKRMTSKSEFEKHRFPIDKRVEVYKKLAEYQEHVIPGFESKLSTEHASVWEDAGLVAPSTKISTRPQGSLKRVLITPSASKLPHTYKVIKRIRAKDSDIPITFLEDEKVKFPESLSTGDEKYWYSMESLVLTTRKGSFCTIFAAPGKVVENIGTLLVLAWYCESSCDFCYLQKSQRVWKEIYMNVEDLPRQIDIELYLYRAALTIWSSLSFYQKQSHFKIPGGYKKEIDRIRIKFLKDDVDTDQKAIKYLQDNLAEIFNKMGIPNIDGRKLPKMKRDIATYYNKNKQYRPRLNISEYTDIITVDPLSGFMDHLMQILPNHPGIDLNLRTVSSHVDEMLKYPGNGQVRFTMNFNTEYAIKEWQSGTASLDERFVAAKKVQNASGYALKVIIEPIIYYDGCEDEYAALTERMMTELDPNNIEDISFATARYNKQLISRINRNYPNTTLFNHVSKLVDPTKPDTKIRYDFNWRVGLFKRLIAIVKKYSTASIRLGGDKAEVWDAVGLDKTAHIDNSVYQYPG